MPNHVKNKVMFSGLLEDIQKMREFMTDEESVFSFNRLVPMPPELLKNDGWYDWRLNHWGTKWNSWDVEWTQENEVEFSTAWTVPYDIYRALSEKFPGIHFDVYYADEDLGHNCGEISYDGDFLVRNDREDFDFACEVWDLDPEEVRQEMEEA